MLKNRQLSFDFPNQLRAFVKQLQLVRLELVLGAFNRFEQEVPVIAAVLNHGRVFIGREKDLFPQGAVLGQNRMLHQLLMQLRRLVRCGRLRRNKGCNFSLFAAVVFLAILARAAGGKTEHQQRRGQ